MSTRTYRIFCLALSALTLAACTSGPIGFARTNEYHQFLDTRVHDKKLYDDGRTVLQVKVMAADNLLVEEQKKLFPRQEIEINSAKANFVVAITQQGRDPLISTNLKFEYQGKKASTVSEIQDQTIIENHYPFAYPFHRVFLVTFDSGFQPSGVLFVSAPVGALSFDEPGPGGAN